MVPLLLSGCTRPKAYTVIHEAQPIPQPAPGEKVVLRVATPEGERAFTMRQLKALRTVEYRTRNMHLNRTFTYRGVLLSDLAKETRIDGRNLRLEAVNNYGETIAAEDYGEFPILLAYEADGRPIPMEEKGPLTTVLPVHAYPKRFPDFKYGSQWVWYVNQVKPQ